MFKIALNPVESNLLLWSFILIPTLCIFLAKKIQKSRERSERIIREFKKNFIPGAALWVWEDESHIYVSGRDRKIRRYKDKRIISSWLEDTGHKVVETSKVNGVSTKIWGGHGLKTRYMSLENGQIKPTACR